jgi:hypothetical protein
MAKKYISMEEFTEDDWDDSEHPKPLSQVSLVADIMLLMDKVYGFEQVQQRHLNACVKAANALHAEFSESKKREADPGCGMEAWLASDERGMSSEHMARILWPLAKPGAVLYLNRPVQEIAYPHDPADLNRCRKLLLAVPELVPHLPAMAQQGPVWKAYVDNWPELIAMLEEELPSGRCQKTYERMRQLQDEASKT